MHLKTAAIGLILGLGLLQGAQAAMINESCTDCPLGIPPSGTSGTTDSFINVGAGGTIQDLDIFVNLTHSFTGDLDIFVIHDAVTVQLYDRSGGSGANITDVTFDDEAATAIDAASPPYGPGSFRPDPDVLSAFDGLDVNGSWQLRIVDNFTGDSGTLLDWSVIAEVQQPAAPLPATGLLLLAGLAGLPLMRRRSKAISVKKYTV